MWGWIEVVLIDAVISDHERMSINISQISCVRQRSGSRASIVLANGQAHMVRGTYQEILDRIRDASQGYVLTSEEMES